MGQVITTLFALPVITTVVNFSKLDTKKVITCFSNFNEQDFLFDLQNSGLQYVYQIKNPDEAVEFWTKTFISVYDKHAPFRKKRVKHVIKPPWITREIDEEICYRDFLLKSGKRELFLSKNKEIRSHQWNVKQNASIFKHWLFHAKIQGRSGRQ